MVTHSEIAGRLRCGTHDTEGLDPTTLTRIAYKHVLEQRRGGAWENVQRHNDELDTVHEKYRDKIRKMDAWCYLAFMFTHASRGLYNALVQMASIENELQRFASIAHKQVRYEEIEITV